MDSQRLPSDDQLASDDWLSEGNPNTAQPPGDISEGREDTRTATKKAGRPALSDRSNRADAIAAKTAREHAQLVTAVHLLENALASPAADREVAWKRNAAPALSQVIEALKTHRESAESQGGVIAEAEAVLGRPPEIRAALNQHKRLTKEASEILAALDEGDLERTVQEIRRRGWRLASSLHDHRAIEADLMMEAFQRDVGGEG
jgi:hypothetical protein